MLVKPSIALIKVMQTVDLARFIKFLCFVKKAMIKRRWALTEHVFCFMHLAKIVLLKKFCLITSFPVRAKGAWQKIEIALDVKKVSFFRHPLVIDTL